jgi:hypothetical protein
MAGAAAGFGSEAGAGFPSAASGFDPPFSPLSGTLPVRLTSVSIRLESGSFGSLRA